MGKESIESLDEGENREEPPRGEGPTDSSSEQAVEAASRSVANELHPDRNEDAFFANAKRGAFGVFDGVGGEAGGREAAELVRDYVETRIEEDFPRGLQLKEAEKRMRKLLEGANTFVLQEQLLQGSGVHPERKEMGTTATIVKLLRGEGGERKAVIGHAGDTRAYLVRGGKLAALTLDDHTAFESLHLSEKRARILQERLSEAGAKKELDEDPQLSYAFGNRHYISNVLGRKGTEPRVYAADMREGDALLLTSDGIHDNLTDREIAEILGRETDPQRAADALVAAAKERSRDQNHLRAKPDDMTAVVVAQAESKHIG